MSYPLLNLLDDLEKERDNIFSELEQLSTASSSQPASPAPGLLLSPSSLSAEAVDEDAALAGAAVGEALFREQYHYGLRSPSLLLQSPQHQHQQQPPVPSPIAVPTDAWGMDDLIAFAAPQSLPPNCCALRFVFDSKPTAL